MADQNLEPLEGIKVIRIWKLEIRYSQDENLYIGTWKWDKGDRLVGSFYFMKKKK